jgi:hypothetical protein
MHGRSTIHIERRTPHLTLTRRVHGVKLKKGARVEVRVSHPAFIARIFRFTVKRFGGVPVRTDLCQAPHARRPAA